MSERRFESSRICLAFAIGFGLTGLIGYGINYIGSDQQRETYVQPQNIDTESDEILDELVERGYR